MGAIEVVPADSNKTLKQFVELPYRLDRGDPYSAPTRRTAVNEWRDRAGRPTELLKILYYQRLINYVGVLALGVVEEYRPCGVAAGFYATFRRDAKRLGFGPCEFSWVLENDVPMNRFQTAMGAKRYKTYRIYEWN